jgi:surface antigen
MRNRLILACCGVVLVGCATPHATPATPVVAATPDSPAPYHPSHPHHGHRHPTVEGVLVGSEASSLDQGDQDALRERTRYALEFGPTGEPVAWSNPASGHSGTVIPARAYQDNGNYCREYQQTMVIDGQTQQAFGRACRQPDGSWQIQG